MCIDGTAFLVKSAATCRSNQHRLSAFLLYLVDKGFQTGHKRVIGAFTGTFLLLVIVSEFNENIISFLYLRHNLFQAVPADKCIGG